VAEKVHVFGPAHCLWEIELGEVTHFVGSGLDPVSVIRTGAERIVFKGSAGGWIDDGVYKDENGCCARAASYSPK
jgi:hypothetical protein